MSASVYRKQAAALQARNEQLLRLLRIARNGLAMARLHIWDTQPFAVNAEAVRRIDRALGRSDPERFGNIIPIDPSEESE